RVTAAWGGAQAHRQGGSPARGNRLCEPACGPCPLDAGAVGRRHGQADRAREPVGRDGASAVGRKWSQAWRRDMWCIPRVDGEYVARMEDVLDLYAEAPDPKR